MSCSHTQEATGPEAGSGQSSPDLAVLFWAGPDLQPVSRLLPLTPKEIAAGIRQLSNYQMDLLRFWGTIRRWSVFSWGPSFLAPPWSGAFL